MQNACHYTSMRVSIENRAVLLHAQNKNELQLSEVNVSIHVYKTNYHILLEKYILFCSPGGTCRWVREVNS